MCCAPGAKRSSPPRRLHSADVLKGARGGVLADMALRPGGLAGNESAGSAAFLGNTVFPGVGHAFRGRQGRRERFSVLLLANRVGRGRAGVRAWLVASRSAGRGELRLRLAGLADRLARRSDLFLDLWGAPQRKAALFFLLTVG